MSLDIRVLNMIKRYMGALWPKKVLKTMEEVEANTNETNLVAAPVVAELSNKLAGQPQFVYGSDGEITGYKTQGGADTVFPFSSASSLLSLFENAFDYSNTIGDIAGYFGHSRYLQRKSNEPALLGFAIFSDNGYASVAIISKSQSGVDCIFSSGEHCISSIGSGITPKGNTVYYRYILYGISTNSNDYYLTINGKENMVGVNRFKCPLILDGIPNPLALWFADELLF